jgi:hypothetical protein
MAYDIIWEKDGVWVRYHENITGDDIMDVGKKILGSNRYDDLHYSIVDTTDIENERITEHETDMLAAIVSSSVSYKRDFKFVFVTQNANLRKMIKRFVRRSKKHGSTWVFQIVESIEEARTWVNQASRWSNRMDGNT